MAVAATIVLTLCLVLVIRSSGSPLLRVRKNGEDPTLQINPYDAGPVDSCELPAGDRPAALCDLSFPIPSSLAKIAHIIEGEIAVTVEKTTDRYDATCAAAVGDLHCRQRFPRCSDDGQAVVFSLSEEDCINRITADCPGEDFLPLCYSLNRTAPIGNCRPVAEYSSAEDFQFEHCPIDSDMQVTEWQYELLKLEDSKVDNNLLIPPCEQPYKKYVCQYVGRCWDEGRRVQVVNNVEDCEGFVSCYNDAIEGVLMEFYQCSLWPSRFTQLTPATTEPTTTTAPTQLTTQNTQPTWPSAATPPDLGGGGTVGGSAASLTASLVLLLVAALVGLQLAI